MNSPICTTPSRPPFAGLAVAALLLAACAGDRPDPARPIDPALPAAQAAEPEKGQGNLSFHYSNKTTDANLAIDLSSTDVYLEMTGKPAQEQADQLRAEGKPDARKAAPAGRKPAASGEEAKAPEPKADDETEDEGAEAKGEKTSPPSGAQAGKGLHKGPPKKTEPPPEEDPGDYEDVTTKVLAGIRRAQELFYQKRYPEALQAARSSLDARPTAEGYGLLGSIYFMQGNTGMARRQWMEALRLNPDMPAVVNMLDKTRTPGGRGSPAPRPVYHPPARSTDPEVPYPEEYSSPGSEAAPSASSAPAAPDRPVPSAPARPVAPAAAPAAPSSAAPTGPAVEAAVPASAAPQPGLDEDASVPAPSAPAVSPAPAPARAASGKAAAKDTAVTPKASPKVAAKNAPKAAPATAKPAQEGTR